MEKNHKKITTKDPVEKIARKRLSVLQLAESLGNVTEACEKLTNIHDAQLINYLKATKLKLGYLLNFCSKNKLEFKRLVY